MVQAALHFRGIAELIGLPRGCWRELDLLSQRGDPDTQAALDRLLQRRGQVLHRVRSHNLTTTQGKDYAVPALLPNGSWFIGAKGAGTAVAADTMASHASWIERTTYTQATRPALTLGAPVAGVADNSGAVALFTTPTGGLTYTGWFVCDSPTKGGTTGVLISVADHTSPQVLVAGAVLRQTLVATVS